MINIDFVSLPKIVLVAAVITLYLTVTIAIIKSLCFSKKRSTCYDVDFIFSDQYKGINKRKEERIKVNLNATISKEAGLRQIDGKIKDISQQGLGFVVESNPDLSCGDNISISITGNDTLEGEKIYGKIVWKKKQENYLFFGVQFLQKNNQLINFVSYLKKQIQK